MPAIVMFVSLCPEGAEGTTYAMLTTITNIGGTVSGDFGTALLPIWNVSNEALKQGDFKGVVKLSILTTVLSVSVNTKCYLLISELFELSLS